MTSTEYKKAASENIVKYFVNRQSTCGELRKEDVGKMVTLVGWLDSKKHGKFLQLKDGYGMTQIIVDAEETEIRQSVANVRDDSIVLVTGRVIARPPSSIGTNSETGEIEILVTGFKILDPEAAYINENGDPETSETMEVDTATSSLAPQQISPRVIEKPKPNLYTYRTHNCGELNESNIGQEVTVTGWLEFHRLRKFFTLRDGYGCTQVIIPDELCTTYKIDSISYESVLKVTGLVLGRPIGMKNETMATGGIEVNMKSLVVLNESKKNLPIEMRTFNRTKENLRLEYRYLDLRFSDMQKNLRTRSKVLMKMREYLINHCGFVEVETPTLFRRTPGGAQEFIVPSRMPGKFYSLVQSPQQFKQMLMVGAIDRYFQIARCYRDEATRPDRQPEFTQLDIELSFTDREHIMSLVEAILVNCWPESNGTLSIPFQKMTYDEAMEKYGSDKPDLRFDMQLQNISNLVSLNEDLAKATPGFAAYALVLKHPHSNVKNQLKKQLKDLEKDLRAQLVFSKITTDTIMEWVEGPLQNLFTSVVLKALAANLHLEPNDLIVISYGKKSDCVSRILSFRCVIFDQVFLYFQQTLMGRVRTHLYNDLEERGLVAERVKEDNKFLWVIDFPMFTMNDETKALESTHHPFTAPHPEDQHLLLNEESRLHARSQAYDLVLNGQEIGGGSIRIHESKLQKFVLDDILKLDRQHLKHMIEALQSGAPPHGGIALGIDRIMSIICNTESIRDVIAFPKGLEGKDPLSKAPCEISDEEKKLYHITIVGKGEETVEPAQDVSMG